jgi:hypothetical protein
VKKTPELKRIPAIIKDETLKDIRLKFITKSNPDEFDDYLKSHLSEIIRV